MRTSRASTSPRSAITPAQVARIVALVEAGTLNDKLARSVIEGVVAGEGDPDASCRLAQLAVVSDDSALLAAIDEALAAQPDVAEKIRSGKVAAAGAIVGAVMKATRGQADAARVRELVLERWHLGEVTVAKLIYSAITSLDGYIADEDGNFDWAAPDEEVHAFVNDLERPVGTYLYGRRMYEVMVYWETAHTLADQSPVDAGLRADLAGGRQDRVLHDAGDGVQRQDADRARLRPGSGPAAEGVGGA